MYPIAKWKRFVIGSGLFIGLLLTILSWINACTEACAEGHSYRLFGMPFEWTGLMYFAVLIPSFFLSRTKPLFKHTHKPNAALHGCRTHVYIGSEIHDRILVSYLSRNRNLSRYSLDGCASENLLKLKTSVHTGIRSDLMSSLKRIFGSLSAFAIGFTIALVGIAKKEELHASQGFEQHIAFGKTNSPVEIYVFTSWICPACRRFEPTLEAMAPGLMQNAKLIFVDYGVDDITLNFLPFNLSFMFYNKTDYLRMRGALKELSDKTNEPSDRDVAAAVGKLGLKYKEVNYANVAAAIQYFKEKATTLKIKSLPSLAIINNENQETAVLVGNEITPKAVEHTISKISKQK